MIDIIFRKSNGSQVEASASPGQNVMQVAVKNGIDEILAECGGSLSCATCHVYVDEKWMDKLDTPPAIEVDMLDCAMDTNEQSRLSCQIILSKQHNGLIINLPDAQF